MIQLFLKVPGVCASEKLQVYSKLFLQKRIRIQRRPARLFVEHVQDQPVRIQSSTASHP